MHNTLLQSSPGWSGYKQGGFSGTQYIDSLYQKVKQVVKQNTEIVKFFQNLLVFIASHQKESEYSVIDSVIWVPVGFALAILPRSLPLPWKKYLNYITDGRRT